RPPAERLVQRPERLLPRRRETGRYAGHRLREAHPDGAGPLRLRHDGGSRRRPRPHRRGLRDARGGGAPDRRRALRRGAPPRAPPRRRGARLMRVVVTGLVAAYPVGGVAWDYLQYVQGFRALGCDVFYLEDTGQWLYDAVAQTFTDDATRNA